MNKRLNTESIVKAMELIGYNNSQLADKLSVSRTIVGDWLSSKKFPRPDKLVRLGLALKLSHHQLVIDEAPVTAVVNFRKKAHRNIADAHYSDGLKKAILLDQIADFLPEDSLEIPPVLKSPTLDYDYLQKAITLVRSYVNKSPKDAVSYSDLIHIIHKYDVIPIPVFWGISSDRGHDAHGLHVESPKTKKEWIYINLDSYLLDFKFWVSHEIGHVVTKNTCDEDLSEKFADLFAQSFLFPKDMAQEAYEVLISLKPKHLVSAMISMADPLLISPYTVYKSVNLYAQAKGMRELPKLGNAYVGIMKYVESKSTLIEKLKADYRRLTKGRHCDDISPNDYIKLSEMYFETPIFDALKRFLVETSRGDGFLQSILGIQSVEAKELHYYLAH